MRSSREALFTSTPTEFTQLTTTSSRLFFSSFFCQSRFCQLRFGRPRLLGSRFPSSRVGQPLRLAAGEEGLEPDHRGAIIGTEHRPVTVKQQRVFGKPVQRRHPLRLPTEILQRVGTQGVEHHDEDVRTGLADRETIPFRRLSYAEQRLVLIARALIKLPKLLILDEPTQGLDDKNRSNLLDFLEKVAENRISTILYVSHRPDEYRSFFRQQLEIELSVGAD